MPGRHAATPRRRHPVMRGSALLALVAGGVFAVELPGGAASHRGEPSTAAAGLSESMLVHDRVAAGHPTDGQLPDLLPILEQAQQRASRSQARPPLKKTHEWVRSDVGYCSSPYGWRWGALHPGDDLAGPWGSPILAATDGVVTFAGVESGYGNLILIQDWDGTVTAYGHLSSFVSRVGTVVKAGDEIAREGMTGAATGPHLHFEVRVDGKAINPTPYMAARGVRLCSS